MFRILRSLLTVACLWEIVVLTAAAQTWTTAAMTGEAAAGGNGQYGYQNFHYLNDHGLVDFRGYGMTGTSGGTSDNAGLFSFNVSMLTAQSLVREGEAEPGGNGQFGYVELLGIDNQGRTLFSATLNGTAGGNLDDTALYLESSGAISTLARRGDWFASLGGYLNTIFHEHSHASGVVSFGGSLSSTLGGPVDQYALYRWQNGATQTITSTGESAPDGNGQYTWLDNRGANAAGNVGYFAILENTSQGGDDDVGLFRGDGTIQVQIAREGDFAPGGNGVFDMFEASRLNDAGELAFIADLRGTAGGLSDNSGVYLGNGTAVTELAREGDWAPGFNGRFARFLNQPQLNNAGQVAFHATLRETSGGSADDSAIYRASAISFVEVFRAGDAAPDGGAFGAFTAFSLGPSPAVAALARKSDGAGGLSNDYGLYLSDGIETLPVIASGQSFNGLQVERPFLDSVEGILNRHGQLAYRVLFENGAEAIQVYTPELQWRFGSSGFWSDPHRWTLSLQPGDPHRVHIAPQASVTVAGPQVETWIRELDVGGGNGLVTLQLNGSGALHVQNGTTIFAHGTLTGDGQLHNAVLNEGRIETPFDGAHHLLFDFVNNMGRIGDGRMTFSQGLTNSGVIEGSGWTNLSYYMAWLDNSYNGEIRVASGGYRRITGAVTNQGSIEVLGGEIEFDDSVLNDSFTGGIAARQATLRFQSGLQNYGGLGFTFGTSDVTGDIDNYGAVQLAGGAAVTFYDDFAQYGSLIVSALGGTHSTAVIFGEFSGPGGFTGGGELYALGDLRLGASPASVLFDGSLFLGPASDTFIELAGLQIGEFDQLRVTGDFSVSGRLAVDLIDGFQLLRNQSFLIADVGGDRLGEFFGLGEGALVGRWNDIPLYITYLAGSGNDIALFSSVPEPRAGLCLVIALLAMLGRRRLPGARATRSAPPARRVSEGFSVTRPTQPSSPTRERGIGRSPSPITVARLSEPCLLDSESRATFQAPPTPQPDA